MINRDVTFEFALWTDKGRKGAIAVRDHNSWKQKVVHSDAKQSSSNASK